jgi:hypothetical protein
MKTIANVIDVILEAFRGIVEYFEVENRTDAQITGVMHEAMHK